MHRIKGTNSLFTNQDEQIMKYDWNEIIAILRDNRYHSPVETCKSNPEAQKPGPGPGLDPDPGWQIFFQISPGPGPGWQILS